MGSEACGSRARGRKWSLEAQCHVGAMHVAINGVWRPRVNAGYLSASAALYLIFRHGLLLIGLKLGVDGLPDSGQPSRSCYLCPPVLELQAMYEPDFYAETWDMTQASTTLGFTHWAIPLLTSLYMSLLCISGHLLSESFHSQHCLRRRERPLLKISFSGLLGLLSFIIVFSRVALCSGGASSKCCSWSVVDAREFAYDPSVEFQRLPTGDWESYFFGIVIGNRRRTMIYLITIIIIFFQDWIKIALIFYYKIPCKNAVSHFFLFPPAR